MPFFCFIIFTISSLLSFISPTFASPAASTPSNQTSREPASKLAVAVARPPKPPVCPPDLGPRRGWTKFFARDCDMAIAKIPRDTRPAAPLRNFYLLTTDKNPTMPNVQLPVEVEYGTWEEIPCTPLPCSVCVIMDVLCTPL
ncbi:MAG: hypothetical protein L6R35_003106 [Caloplaca aegaea]|nr:MAG: hypothetical protein L6R35_003106 [Caloplaca aegaea]